MRSFLAVTGILLIAACSRNNNLLLGRVQATVGTHTVVVTDCYRTSVPEPRRLPDEGGHAVWCYTPCRDADVWIRGEQLTVNGRDYGRLNPADGVLVDHGVVSIQRHPPANRTPRAAVQPPWEKTSSTRYASFVSRRVSRVRHSWSFRLASARIRRCSRWCTRFFSALSP